MNDENGISGGFPGVHSMHAGEKNHLLDNECKSHSTAFMEENTIISVPAKTSLQKQI